MFTYTENNFCVKIKDNQVCILKNKIYVGNYFTYVENNFMTKTDLCGKDFYLCGK